MFDIKLKMISVCVYEVFLTFPAHFNNNIDNMIILVTTMYIFTAFHLSLPDFCALHALFSVSGEVTRWFVQFLCRLC